MKHSPSETMGLVSAVQNGDRAKLPGIEQARCHPELRSAEPVHPEMHANFIGVFDRRVATVQRTTLTRSPVAVLVTLNAYFLPAVSCAVGGTRKNQR